MNITRIKFHTYFKGIILIGFTLFFFKLWLTGKLGLFISPKLYPFIPFTFIVLIVLGIIQIFIGTSDQKETPCPYCIEHMPPKNTFRSIIYYSFFIVPIVTGLLFSDHTLGSSIAKNRQIQYTTIDKNTQNKTEKSSPNAQEMENESTSQGESNTQNTSITQRQYITQKEFDTLKQTLLNSRSIKINDNLYVPTVGILEENLDKFVGKEIETIGFVYRDKDFTNNQIVVARFVITCCIADASVYGIMARGNVANLKNDSWVRIKGKVGKYTYNSTTIPILTITSLEEIHEPNNPYVYNLDIKVD